MRRLAPWLCLLVLISALLGGCQEESASTPASPTPKAAGAGLVGQPAPDFSLPLVGGGSLKLSDLRGKVVLVNFWATWCPPCRAEMPSMERLYAQTRQGGFEIVAVNVETDGLQILPDFLKDHPHNFPVLVDVDGEVQTTYGVFRFPESFLVDAQGVIVEHIIGGRDWAAREMVDKVKALTAK